MTPADAPAGRPLRVLQFICPTGYYGAERWVTALANNADPATVVHSLAVTDEPGNAEPELCDAFRAIGRPVHALRMSHRFDLRAIRRLAELLRRERFDVLHTHGYKSDLIGVLGARFAGVPSVCTPHGFENSTDLKLRAFIALGNRSFRYFDRVVPLSRSLCDEVARMGVKRERLRYIANGVDLKAIDATRAAAGADRGARVVRGGNDGGEGSDDRDDGGGGGGGGGGGQRGMTIGFVGQLIERKNLGDLLDVFERLAAKHAGARLVLAGDGDRRAALERRVAASAYADRVEFRGFVADALPCYLDFDLFVMTSSLEGIPRCLMEAMANEVPIAAYDIPGVDQLVEHERTGMLAPYGNEEALFALCERLLVDDETARRITVAARLRVHERFSAARMALEYAALYRELARTG